MWIKLLFCCYVWWSYLITVGYGHIPSHVSTPSSQIDRYCALAEMCVHDTIPICGTMGVEKRTFLDDCDLLEFACDTNQIYTHVDDTTDCPDPKALKRAKG